MSREKNEDCLGRSLQVIEDDSWRLSPETNPWYYEEFYAYCEGTSLYCDDHKDDDLFW